MTVPAAPFEFDPEQDAFIRSLALGARVQGVLFYVIGAVGFGLGLVAMISGGGLVGVLRGGVGLGYGIMGVALLRAARSFRAITGSRGKDILHLMEGLGWLKGYYQVLSGLSLFVGIASILFALVAGPLR